MHYEINYKGHATVADADRAALKDIAEWMGQERYDRLCETFAALEQPMSQEDFAVVCSFAGIQGYPVEAWYRSLWPSCVVIAAVAGEDYAVH